MKTPKDKLILFFSILLLFLCSCRTVRQVDLDSWVGVPVEALDLHSFWMTIPMVKTLTDNGIEIRIYVNKKNVSTCFKNAGLRISDRKNYLQYANFTEFQNCVSGTVGCDNIFYIKDGKVLEYVPVGNCYTDKFLQPEERYKRLINIK